MPNPRGAQVHSRRSCSSEFNDQSSNDVNEEAAPNTVEGPEHSETNLEAGVEQSDTISVHGPDDPTQTVETVESNKPMNTSQKSEASTVQSNKSSAIIADENASVSLVETVECELIATGEEREESAAQPEEAAANTTDEKISVSLVETVESEPIATREKREKSEPTP